jgi:hypothetical protein
MALFAHFAGTGGVIRKANKDVAEILSQPNVQHGFSLSSPQVAACGSILQAASWKIEV